MPSASLKVKVEVTERGLHRPADHFAFFGSKRSSESCAVWANEKVQPPPPWLDIILGTNVWGGGRLQLHS